MAKDSFASRATFRVGGAAGGRELGLARLDALEGYGVSRLPYALRILLENLLRREDGSLVSAGDIEALARWQPHAVPGEGAGEIAFMPARVLLQDFTGVPAVVDLAAMRDAIAAMAPAAPDAGGHRGTGLAKLINPIQPVELVIDHSVQVDEYGSAAAFLINADREFERNRERYAFLRWGQSALANFKVVPPDTGIVHQVNLEYLARVVMTGDHEGVTYAFPDTLVGTDSHTTMINGLGVLGWGVGGIEAEAAMLGQPVSMLIPQVVGVRLAGELPEGATATDLVLVVTEMLRRHGVVGKFVEFYGPGLAALPLADRATIANMAPEYGATCGIFPVDDAALEYLRFTGRPAEQVALVETYMKEQGLFHSAASPEAEYSELLRLDLGSVRPSLAGPRRPQDRVLLADVKSGFQRELGTLMAVAPGRAVTPAPQSKAAAMIAEGGAADPGGTAMLGPAPRAAAAAVATLGGRSFSLHHGAVVIAAITSCTNTSNPSVMVAAGLLAKKAVERGLTTPPWVKTSLAPGSKVVTEYLREAGLTPYLEQLGFHLVGYGCTTCIGNSGPLPPPIAEAIESAGLVAVSVLSGNRNFEGRINSEVRANYLASPPLVVAYALAGRIDVDLTSEPLGIGSDGKPVHLADVWPSRQEIAATVLASLRAEMFHREYSDVFAGDERWNGLPVPAGDTYAWEESSTYVRQPPYFADMPAEPPAVEDIRGARVLGVFGDSITTDHISPAGSIKAASPAGKYLIAHGVQPKDFNSYGSRRGNHEVMMRGTFANVRIRNRMVPEIEGGFTLHLPSGEPLPIYDAAMRYQQAGVPTVIFAGKEYGTGSSRDWAAKGPRLLGVCAVIAESFERIHRSNLVGMGVVPLELTGGDTVQSLGITGREVVEVEGLAAGIAGGWQGGREVTVRATPDADPAAAAAPTPAAATVEFKARVRLDTPQEVQYYRHGGILHYVLRQLLKQG
ncbi:MAG TPA: aconitate hydratase AcnA [Thermoanaerobaculia bacterium]|nr:aconitate hydratase AcnA [Thermoanaerobaculia bacterium]